VRRGDLVPVLPGAYGKPRPALLIQSDLFSLLPSITVLPVTTELRPLETFRIAVKPTAKNGLRQPSQIMVDKAHTIPRDKAGEPFGHLEPRTLQAVERALAVFLGFADAGTSGAQG
jgi:mRNA interferase MazF